MALVPNHTYSGDTIEKALAAPIDWGKLEGLAYDVLVADDFPTLRKIGGVGDEGMDSVDESFYDGARQVTTVVQVTSAQGQRAKVHDTIAKLSKNGISATTLVFLTRHPVSAQRRTEMIEEADSLGVALDVRDQSYLVAQLSKNTTIFARHFAHTAAQLAVILATPDPLHAASNRQQHALLATLGAYVLSDHSRLARGALFEKTVLAALAASREGTAGKDDLLNAVRELLPMEAVDRQQLDSAVEHLVRSGDCTASGDIVKCSESAMLKCVSAATSAEAGFNRLQLHLIAQCEKATHLTDVLRGYLERNLRRAIVHLLRVSGPLRSDDDRGVRFDASDAAEVREVLTQDLPPEVGHAALIAFSSFVTDPELGPALAPLVKSYAALAIRNLDPIGRRWQRAVLARSVIAIDTDVLLYVIVEELPEHRAVLSALRSLQEAGVEIVIPEHVFAEAVGHLERAPRTYKRFADRLLRFPAELVNARVWHAVVRGYYYAKHGGYNGSFEQYYGKYHDPAKPDEFVEHLISRRLPLKLIVVEDVAKRDGQDLNAISDSILEFRERSRRKATFRDPVEMAQRVREDVALALSMAARDDQQVGATARGYIGSSDHAFRMIESHGNWRPRKSVHIWSSALPQFAFFACGSTLEPNDAVAIVFNPVTVAAAELLATEINILASIGVKLKGVSLDRLDWDLRQGLSAKLDVLGQAVAGATTDDDIASASATLAVAQAAGGAGYEVIPQVQTLIQEFDATKDELASERTRRRQAEEQLRHLVAAVREQSTNKPRRRFNQLVEELGISLDGERRMDGDDDDD